MSHDTPHEFRTYQAEVAFSGQDGPLPPHHPTCFGCGNESDPGLHLAVRREAGQIHAEVTFADWQAGAPGIVHGGMVSAVCDDFLGFGLYLAPRIAVTRALEVSFGKPALVGVPYALRGWVDEAHEHKAWFAGEATDPDGAVVFSARALFVNVRGRHFDQGMVTP